MCVYDKTGRTQVVTFPVEFEPGAVNVKSIDNITMKEQLNIVQLMQDEWADNMVSATVTLDNQGIIIKEKELRKIESRLESYEDHLRQTNASPWNMKSKMDLLEMAKKNVTDELEQEKLQVKQDIVRELMERKNHLKSVSFLPRGDDTWPQKPYQGIDKQRYLDLKNKIKPFDIDALFKQMNQKDVEGDKYCNTDKCEVTN